MENWLWIISLVAVGILVLGISSGITGRVVEGESNNYCYDSDGTNADTPGLIKYDRLIFPETTELDTCTDDKKAVNEKYCNGDNSDTKKISCPNGCILIQGYAFGKNVTAGACAD
jgi:hypothetical protein